MDDQGWEVLRKNGCNACHSQDGSKLIGPSYLGGWVTSRGDLMQHWKKAFITVNLFYLVIILALLVNKIALK